MRGPGKIPFRAARRRRKTCNWWAAREGAGTESIKIYIVHTGVGKVRNCNKRGSHTSTNERGHTPPGAKIHISVGKKQPFGFAGAIVVNAVKGLDSIRGG